MAVCGVFILLFLDRSYEKKIMSLNGLVHQRRIKNIRR